MFMFALSVTGVCAPTVKADEWNMETKITINQPIEAEGTVLRVGSYVLMLVDLPADRSTVAFRRQSSTTFSLPYSQIQIYRTEPPDKGEFKFYEPRPPSSPRFTLGSTPATQ